MCTSIHLSDCFSGKLSVVYKQQLRHLCVCELKERGNTCSCFFENYLNQLNWITERVFLLLWQRHSRNNKFQTAKKFSNNSDKKLVKLDLHRQLQFSRNYSFPLCLLLVLFSLFPFFALFFLFITLWHMYACLYRWTGSHTPGLNCLKGE